MKDIRTLLEAEGKVGREEREEALEYRRSSPRTRPVQNVNIRKKRNLRPTLSLSTSRN